VNSQIKHEDDDDNFLHFLPTLWVAALLPHSQPKRLKHSESIPVFGKFLSRSKFSSLPARPSDPEWIDKTSDGVNTP